MTMTINPKASTVVTTNSKTSTLIGLRAGNEVIGVGNEAQFYALMSTISLNLEPRGWGTKYPMMMRHLYPGQLGASDVRYALEEIVEISEKLSKMKADKLVWDITDPVIRPDEKQLWMGAPNLLDVFRTADGERAMDAMKRALIAAMKKSTDVYVELTHRAA